MKTSNTSKDNQKSKPIKSYYIFDNYYYNQSQILKLYQDTIEWFWDNSEKIYDYYEIFMYGVKVTPEIKKMILKSTFSDGYYNISAFETKKVREFENPQDFEPVVSLSSNRLTSLHDFLTDRGWKKDSLLNPEDCPAFMKEQKTEDHIVAFFSLIGWDGLKDIEKQKIIKYFKSKKYRYYPKVGMIKNQKCKNRRTEYIYQAKDIYKIQTDNSTD